MDDQNPIFTATAVAIFASSIAVITGQPVGEIVMGPASVTEPQRVVGILVRPVEGKVHVETDDKSWIFEAGRLSFYGGDEWVTGDDWEWFRLAWLAGNPLSDYDGNGFKNGDDIDLYLIDFLEGPTP